MADYYKCSDCVWKGMGEEAMKPDKEIEEDWKKVWELWKGLESDELLLSKNLGMQSYFFPGAISWEKIMLDTLVCPKCAGEASRDIKKETGPKDQ